MNVFVTGGSGLTAPAIDAELIGAGHKVTGLGRSEKAAAGLRGLNASVLYGSLENLECLQEGAGNADGVVHMAFSGNRSDPDARRSLHLAAIKALGQALAGWGKPLVSASGILVMNAGAVSSEHDEADPQSLGGFRVAGEQACLAFADQAVSARVVRLAPSVHGPGDYGFIPFLISVARRTGKSVYIDDGANRWPAIHRLDAAPSSDWLLKKRRPEACCMASGKAHSLSKPLRTRSPKSSACQRYL